MVPGDITHVGSDWGAGWIRFTHWLSSRRKPGTRFTSTIPKLDSGFRRNHIVAGTVRGYIGVSFLALSDDDAEGQGDAAAARKGCATDHIGFAWRDAVGPIEARCAA